MPISKNKRYLQICEVIDDLNQLKKNTSGEYKYAIDENILFFQASKSIFSYYKWLIMHAKKIIRGRLFEINDLLPKWDKEMHKELVSLEKKKFPGLIAPLVSKIYKTLSSTKERQVVVNLGHGGMETERQIINKLINMGNSIPVIFIGFDQSETSRFTAKENLKELNGVIELIEVSDFNGEKLEEIIKNTNKLYTIILSNNDIFDLEKKFQGRQLNIIFHSLFKHHIVTTAEKDKLDLICTNLAEIVFEYDGYKNWFFMLFPHTFTGWRSPVFLNATIFSDLRYYNKSELKTMARQQNIKIFPVGTYLKVTEYKFNSN